MQPSGQLHALVVEESSPLARAGVRGDVVGSDAGSKENEQTLENAVVMLVDDDSSALEVLRIFLGSAGYRNFVTTTESTEVLELASLRRPDVLLLDLVMPEVGGFDILSAMRADPELMHIPVIMLTLSTDAETKLTALELGATDFLGKPVDPSELYLRLRNTLTAKAYQDRLANFDSLTGLPNRHRFCEHLDRTLWQAGETSGQCAVLHLDLDRFHQINASLGHAAGDGLLKAVAQRLASVVEMSQSTSQESTFLGRVGGDEFSVIIPALNDPDDVCDIAEKITASMNNAFTLGGREYFIKSSLGVSIFPDDGEDRDTLMRHVGIATSHAKQRGDKKHQVYSRDFDRQATERLLLENRLHKAIEHDELELFYQPKISLANGRITGAEALLRWHHPEQGLISPDTFIPIAEESGLIIPIGDWVLHRACQQLRDWKAAGYQGLQISVNVSALQFHASRLLQSIETALHQAELQGHELTIELTESVLMADARETSQTLEEIRALGPKIAVDDFGTGYSSLSYIKRFAIDELKIDRTFISDLLEDSDNTAIVKAVIAMAHELGMAVVAEGVETNVQMEFLRAHNCDEFQGYFASKPTPAQQFSDYVRDVGVERRGVGYKRQRKR